jgi:hypothetical protein
MTRKLERCPTSSENTISDPLGENDVVGVAGSKV